MAQCGHFNYPALTELSKRAKRNAHMPSINIEIAHREALDLANLFDVDGAEATAAELFFGAQERARSTIAAAPEQLRDELCPVRQARALYQSRACGRTAAVDAALEDLSSGKLAVMKDLERFSRAQLIERLADIYMLSSE
jgi:hypothetical protein